MAGTWYLKRDYDYVTDYCLEFDYEVPDSIPLTREDMLAALENNNEITDSIVLTESQNLTAIENDSTISMMTDGKLKPYWYAHDFIGSVLFLRPGS